MKAHEFGEFKVTKEANATEKGSKEKECSVCGYKYPGNKKDFETLSEDYICPLCLAPKYKFILK